MPNVVVVLKDEINRLSKKAVRADVGPLQKSVIAQRRQISELKGQIHLLGREIAALKKSASNGSNGRAAVVEAEGKGTKVRFTAKGLKSLRARLDLSAEEFGRLLEVGGQTIYNWESQKTSPRATQLPAIAELRKIGKKEALQRLASAVEAQPASA